MRRLAAGITGAFALLAMTVMQPWARLGCDPSDCMMSGTLGGWHFYVIGLVVYFLLPLIVVGIIQVAVLGIRDSSQPHDQAVLAALGQTRGSANRAAARRGLVDGAVWVGGAYVLAGAVHLVLLQLSGWPLASDAELWYGRAVVGAITIGGLVLAHVIDAARPRRSPVERLYDEARPVERRRGARIVGVGLAVIAAAASGVVVGLALAYDLAPNFRVTSAAGVAYAVAWVALVSLALVIMVPASRRWSTRWLARVATLSTRDVGPIIAARATSTSRAGGRLVIVLGSGAFLLGAAASVDTSAQLSPTYVGYRIVNVAHDSEAFAQQMREVDGVAGVVAAPVRDFQDSSSNTHAMFALDPDQLRGLDDTLADILTAHPTAVAQHLWNDSAELHFSVRDEYGFTPSGIYPLGTCCELFTNASNGMTANLNETAYLIYSTDRALNETVAAEVWALAPGDVDDYYNYSEGTSRYSHPEGPSSDENAALSWLLWLVNFAILAVLVGAPMIALAVGLARTRRSDKATLAALGASDRSLRAALVIETAAVSAFAVIVGGGLGAVTHAAMTAVQRSRVSLTGVITDNYLATAVGSVAWSALGIAIVATVVVMGATTWIVAHRQRGTTPVEGLRPEPAESVR